MAKSGWKTTPGSGSQAATASDNAPTISHRRDPVMGPLAEAFVRNFAQVSSGDVRLIRLGGLVFGRRYGLVLMRCRQASVVRLGGEAEHEPNSTAHAEVGWR
jgi:hypothetical protein